MIDLDLYNVIEEVEYNDTESWSYNLIYNILYIGKIEAEFCFGCTNAFCENVIDYIILASIYTDDYIDECSLYINGNEFSIPCIHKKYKLRLLKNDIKFVFNNNIKGKINEFKK